MAKRRIIIGFLVCFSIAVFVGQTQSQTSNSDQRIKPPDAERLRYMTQEERKKAFEEWAAQRKRLQEERVAKQRMEFEQRAKDRHDGRNERRNQFLKQILEVTEQQWKVIEPKINKIYFLRNQSSISMGFGGASGSYSGGSGGSSGGYVMQGGSGSGSGGSGQFWGGPTWRLADRELTEGEKACEELFELLQDKNSRPEKIKQKMDALRQAREKARNQLAKVRQELREILNSRQEAKLVLLEVLD